MPIDKKPINVGPKEQKTTSRPFAYNKSQINIPGTYNIGTMCVGDSSQEYINNYGGLHWWNGPDEGLGYCIGTVVPEQNQSTPLGNFGNVKFWRTQTFTDEAFLILVKEVTGQSFTDVVTAYSYLDSNNYWTSYPKQVMTPMIQPFNPNAVQVSYFVVQNRSSRPEWYVDGNSNRYRVIPDGTPSYRLFQKPNSHKTNISDYFELTSDTIGSPDKYTHYPYREQHQYVYNQHGWLTDVTVYQKDSKVIVTYPNDRTAPYGQQVYYNIVSNYI